MEPLSPADPRRIGSYRLLGRLGAGGMGQVFLGESPGQRKVAVKLIRPEHAEDHQFRQRFAREVAAAKMVGGFHTAPVVDADPDGDPPWLATAYISGPSLSDQVRREGALAPEAAARLGAALAEGLAAIHACGLVHRDLKPGNVVLADDGPRIIDFGLARVVESSTDITANGVLVGTLSYMSPEQVSGLRLDARSDIFSLGSVLAFAATGHSPFRADTMAMIATRIVHGPPSLDGIGGRLRGVIADCLAKDPADRPSLDTATIRLAGIARPDSAVSTAPRQIARPVPARTPNPENPYSERISVSAPAHHPPLPSARSALAAAQSAMTSPDEPARPRGVTIASAQPPPASSRRSGRVPAGPVAAVIVAAAIALVIYLLASAGGSAGPIVDNTPKASTPTPIAPVSGPAQP